jgi:histidinol dehydrogenase
LPSEQASSDKENSRWDNMANRYCDEEAQQKVAIKVVPEIVDLGSVFLGQVATSSIAIFTSRPDKVTISSQLIKVVFFDNEK